MYGSVVEMELRKNHQLEPQKKEPDSVNNIEEEWKEYPL